MPTTQTSPIQATFVEEYGDGAPFEPFEDSSESPSDSPRTGWCSFFCNKVCKPPTAAVGLVAANTIYFAPIIGISLLAGPFTFKGLLAGALANVFWAFCLYPAHPGNINGSIAMWGFSDLCCPEANQAVGHEDAGVVGAEQAPATRISINNPRL